MSYLDRAIKEGLVEITSRGRRQYITYHPVEHTEVYSDPEEQVRAEFWAELIYRYQYDARRIGIEITVPDRTPSDRADLVVFRDEERKKPYAVIECKQDGVSDAEFEQAVEQVCGNGTWAKFRASYVMVVAGLTRRSLDFTEAYGVLERDKNIIADIPIRYGKPQEYKYYKGGDLDIAPVSKENLISAIRKCHQTLWGGGRLSPPTAFSELCKIIFVKISDEKKKRKNGEPYQFQIKTHEASTSLAGRIQDLYETEQKRDPDVFTETIKVQDATLVTVVSHMESINLSATDLDVKGLAFEQFMDGFFKGDFGQYFTPRELIDFCVNVLKPTNDDIVLDPACGSGGFLLHALDAVRNEATEYYADGSAEHYAHWHDFAKDKLFGIEINDEIARVAKMNMIIHDDGHSNVIGYDSLEKSAKITKINRNFADERFSLILTNPPFGAALDKAERPYLSEYDLAQQESGGKKKTRNTQRIEILFLERIWRFLMPVEGRAAIVVPDSILTNESLDYVRSWFNEHFRLLCVVSMPVGAFTHFGTSVKTSIVFVRRRKDVGPPAPDERILMCSPYQIGYDTTGRKCDTDLDSVAEQCQKFIESPLTYSPRRSFTSVAVTDFRGIDETVLSAMGVTELKMPRANAFVIDQGHIDGPLNPERYKALWLEDVFVGQTISDIGSIVEEKVNPAKDSPDVEFDLIRIDDLEANPLKVVQTRTELGKDLQGTFYRVQENDILFARLGPTIANRKVVLCPKTAKPTIASPEFHVLRVNEGIDPLSVLAVLRTKTYRDLVYSKGRGATPSRYRVSRGDFLMLPFPKLDGIAGLLAKDLKSRLEKVERLVAEARALWE